MGHDDNSIWPYVLCGFNIDKGDAETVPKYCNIAEALGEEVKSPGRENALKSVKAVECLQGIIGMGRGLGEFGMSKKDIKKLIDYSLRLGG